MNKINKIMIGVPNTRWHNNKYWHIFPYTLGLLTSVLKNNYDVRILDANMDNLNVDEVKNKISEYEPDVFGVSCMSMEYVRGLQEITSNAKIAHPKTKVIVGGIYPTLLPEEVMKDENIDYIILGEGEYRFPKLLKELEKNNPPLEDIDGLAYRDNSNLIVQKVKSYIHNLDDLLLPSYDDIDFFAYANKSNKYSPFIIPRRFPHAQTITSRGCPFNCIFCSSKSINGPNIRYRSTESILKEVDWLVEKYRIKELIFLDDNFYLDRKRLKKTLEELIKRDYDLEWKSVNAAVYALDDEILELMKESKCYQIALAVENGSLEGLKRLKKPYPKKILSNIKSVIKKARSLDFELLGLFIIGTPGETWTEIRQTIKFAEELEFDHYSFSIATPLPNTELYKIAKEKNLLPKDFSFDNLSFKGSGKANITTDEFTPKELEILRAFEWDRLNFRTEENTVKVAKISGLTLKELNAWRISTRRGFGVDVEFNNLD